MKYQLIRKNVKNINIHIKPPDGMVVVTAPQRVPVSRIEEILSEKEAWILKKQQLVQARPAPREYTAVDAEKLTARLNEGLALWTERTGLYPSAVQIRSMTSRWGSCNHRSGSIHFALQLADQSPEFTEYIILHELCHLAVPNHGPEFKKLLDRYMPDWRLRKARQRENRDV